MTNPTVPTLLNFELWATSLPTGEPILQLSTAEPLPFLPDEPLVLTGSDRGYLIKGGLSKRYCFIKEAELIDPHLQQAAGTGMPLYLARYAQSSLLAQWPLRLVPLAPPRLAD